ncbi:hypothetical protein [Rothia aerolata]|uniref:Uncharacterized protein n=1 Tax=Rothia aerolata TaxID=1812262 RepID=A0A917IQR1_9MICC|nr:hypothetical protein [Rothia aerolata]GGH59897.1 hypothetical protein GCM10007359_07530 [Rothia aerolata]
MRIQTKLATAATVGALLFGGVPAATAAEAEAAPEAPASAAGTACPSAEDFSLSAPSHTEVAGNLLNKQITFGAYWHGGNLPAGTQATLTAGPAEVTLLNGQTYTAPVVAGGSISGIFPGGGAAFAPSFRLDDSSAKSLGGATNKDHVTNISYPVTVSGNFGTCTYTVEGTATSKFNVTSINLVENQ